MPCGSWRNCCAFKQGDRFCTQNGLFTEIQRSQGLSYGPMTQKARPSPLKPCHYLRDEMLLTEKILGSKVKPHKVIAHRGMSGKFPENTLLAFDAVRHEGLRWVETDISMLADETLIVFHDEAQGRTVAGDKLVADAKWEDFKNADAGLWKGIQFSGQKVLRLETLIAWAEVHDMTLSLIHISEPTRPY